MTIYERFSVRVEVRRVRLSCQDSAVACPDGSITGLTSTNICSFLD